ncbi:MAG: rhodanese-like domain-containing protein [Armatimonadota bacterium]
MSAVKTCSVQELKGRLERGSSTVVDVRVYPEYAEAHLPGSRLVPLDELKRHPELAGDGEILLLCRSGRRAGEAGALLASRPGVQPVVVEGGIDAWKRAGFPTRQERGPISLERQVRIAAGTLVLTGLLLDSFLPGARFLSYFVAAGLVFAGVTDTCAMGMLLARLPWNRPRTGAACPAGR